MADAPKKPRKIKDLKARLGKTIAPETKKPGGAAVPPPNLGGAKEKAAAVVPPAAAKKPAPGGIVPPSIGGAPAPGGVVKPPFMKEPEPAAPAPSQRPADPFAPAEPSTRPQGPQEVRLVLDDKDVDDAEVGRKKKGKTFLLIGLGLLLGLLLGFGSGSVMDRRKLHNHAVNDAKDIYSALQESSAKISDVQRLIDQAARAAGGAGANKQPSVDYEAIEQLRQIERPFQANVFAHKSYNLFEPSTVDSLFTYYHNVGIVFDQISSLDSLTRGEERREELDAAASAAVESRSLPVGCVMKHAEGQYVCNLGYLQQGSEPGQLEVRATRTGRQHIERQVFQGGEVTEENAGEFVVLVNLNESQGVLGESGALFEDYLRKLTQLKALVDETAEVQGRLETGIGPIAAQEEVFAL